MEARGRKLGRRQNSKESRDSSVSSTSREVRCGCQYFQSDSLLPERHSWVGSRPSSRNMGDHEYEPINPPASQSAPPPLLTVTDQEGQEKITEPERIDFTPIINSPKHQFLRIALDKDSVIPIDRAEIESLRYDDEEEVEVEHRVHEKEVLEHDDIKHDVHKHDVHEHDVHKHDVHENEHDAHENEHDVHDHDVPEHNVHEMTAQEIQDQMEERFFAATPSTTVSRTDGEFNTSQMDSSALDELPLKRDARRGFNAKGFQQKFSSQAGRLRSRIRNISRPKFNFPERPKIHLPDRPKFNLPERPKFNIKRPDLKMPNFSFSKTKTSSIRRPLRDKAQVPSNQSTVGSKKNIFDSINFRTYPRIFSKKKKAAQGRRAFTPPPRMETESTPPSSPASRTGPFNQRWSHRFKDIKFADDDNQSDLKKPSFDDEVEDDSTAFREPDFRTVTALTNTKPMKAESSSSIPGSDREQHSSGSSSERHRAGVIEEIDSDEFFLREKGLSRDDVDVSRYLSLEIRDAFRSPKNALASLDREVSDNENEGYDLKPPHRPSGEPIRLSMEAIRNQSLEQIRMTPERDIELEYTRDEEVMEPTRPERTRSLKKRSTRSQSEEPKPDKENQFNTFPPNKPTRSRRSQSKHSIPADDIIDADKENRSERISSEKRPPSVPSLAITDTTKELSPTRYIDESSEALNEPWREEPQPPLPPKRRKSTRESSQDNESLSAHQYNQQRWIDDVQDEDIVLDNEIALQRGRDHRPLQNGYYDTPPMPMRKSRSRGTSLADEDRTSRGADSLVSETRTHLTEDFPIDSRQEIKAYLDDSDYAVVEKTVLEAKPRSSTLEKPARPPHPSRKKKTVAQLTALKNQGIHFFYTYPRRAIKKSLLKHPQAPVRPTRNYSSIGPARPPRRNRVFREPVYEGEFIPLRDENETALRDENKSEFFDHEKTDSIIIESDLDEKLSKQSDQEEMQDIRDLQSGDVIEKMKCRPLPPPPRPPRKMKEDHDDDLDDEDRDIDLDAEVTDLDADEKVVVERLDIFVGHSRDDQDKNKRSQSLTYEDKPVEESYEWEIEQELQELIPEPAEEQPVQAELQSIPAEPPVKAERRKKSLSVARRAATPVSPVIEATVSTQTDTLPEGFYVEEEQQTTGEYSKSDETVTKTTEHETERKAEVEKKIETIIEHKVVVIPTPETEILKAKKIHVSELEVERLNVTELQAQKITVSDIDGVSLQVTELTSKSGHLVVSGIDLPLSFIEAITPPPPPAPIIQIQSSTQTPPVTVDSQTNTTPQEETPTRQFIVEPVSTKAQPFQETTVSRPSPQLEAIVSKPQIVHEVDSTQLQESIPSKSETAQETFSQPPPPSTLPKPPLPQKRPSPPPSITIQTPQSQSAPAYVPGFIPSSPPPRSPPRSRAMGHDSEDELRMLPRRRRHHSHKQSPMYSSDEDEEEYPSFPVLRRTHQREVTSGELLRQLLNIWQASFMRGVNHMVDGLNSAFPEGEKRKDAQTAACIILVLLAGLIMLGFGSDNTVHHHHWDFLPPHP